MRCFDAPFSKTKCRNQIEKVAGLYFPAIALHEILQILIFNVFLSVLFVLAYQKLVLSHTVMRTREI